MKMQNKGFTLIELSVVLVILGMLVGGIIGASRLVNVSKVNAIIGNYRDITQASALFDAMYSELPGDASATEVQGAKSGNNKTISTSGNGNSDRKIALATTNDGVEAAAFYGHLYKSEILSGPGVPSVSAKADCTTLANNLFVSAVSGTSSKPLKVTPIYSGNSQYLVFSSVDLFASSALSSDDASIGAKSGDVTCSTKKVAADPDADPVVPASGLNNDFMKVLAESIDKKFDGSINSDAGQATGVTGPATAGVTLAATTDDYKTAPFSLAIKI